MKPEERIRAAFEAVSRGRPVGEILPITVIHQGVELHALVQCRKLPSLPEQQRGIRSTLHLTTLKASRLLAGLPVTLNVFHWTLNGRNELREKGYPVEATHETLARFRDAGLPIPTVPVSEPGPYPALSNSARGGPEP